jgi:hypothetical protein
MGEAHSPLVVEVHDDVGGGLRGEVERPPGHGLILEGLRLFGPMLLCNGLFCRNRLILKEHELEAPLRRDQASAKLAT